MCLLSTPAALQDVVVLVMLLQQLQYLLLLVLVLACRSFQGVGAFCSCIWCICGAAAVQSLAQALGNAGALRRSARHCRCYGSSSRLEQAASSSNRAILLLLAWALLLCRLLHCFCCLRVADRCYFCVLLLLMLSLLMLSQPALPAALVVLWCRRLGMCLCCLSHGSRFEGCLPATAATLGAVSTSSTTKLPHASVAATAPSVSDGERCPGEAH